MEEPRFRQEVLASLGSALTVRRVTTCAPLGGSPASHSPIDPADPAPGSGSPGLLAPLQVVRPVVVGAGSALSFRRVGDSLLDAATSPREFVLAVSALREADRIREAVLARPGGFSEQRPIVVDFHTTDDGTVVVDWVRGDYAVTRGIRAVAAQVSAADEVGGAPGDAGPRWLGLGAMGLNVTVRTADDMTAVALRAASMANGGLAHVAMNEGLNAVDVPDSELGAVVGFDLLSATARGLREELGIDLSTHLDRAPGRPVARDVALGVGLEVGLGLRVDSVFEVVGHGLAVSAHVGLAPLGITAADLVLAAAAAEDAWERDALHLRPVAVRQPAVGDVVVEQQRYTSELAGLVGAVGATSWAAWCFAAAGLWPAAA